MAVTASSRVTNRPNAPLGLLCAGGAVALLALIPLGFVVHTALTSGSTQMVEQLNRPRVHHLLFNTVRLVGLGTIACLIIGVGAAWLVECTDLPFKRFWHAAMAAPLAVPAFVNGFAWLSRTSAIQSYWGAILIVTLSYFPLVYLPSVAAIRGLDPGLEDVARSLGRGGVARFFTIVLPAIKPAVLGGGLLVALHMLAEYGALQLINFQTLTTAILEQYQTSFNGPAASILSCALALICLGLLLGEQRIRGNRSLSRVGSGVAREATPYRLRSARIPALFALITLSGLSLGVPIFSLSKWLITGSSTNFPVDELARATGSTLGLAALGAIVTTILALPVAWLAVRYRGPLPAVIERSTYTANALPGIVVALALVTISIHLLRGLYQTIPLLILAYVILYLPRSVVGTRSSLELVPRQFGEVARSLGDSPMRANIRVILPALAPGLFAAGALVALAVSTELTATLLLAPTGTQTLSTQFWEESSNVAYGAAAPYALLMILLSVPATILLARTARRSAA